MLRLIGIYVVSRVSVELVEIMLLWTFLHLFFDVYVQDDNIEGWDCFVQESKTENGNNFEHLNHGEYIAENRLCGWEAPGGSEASWFALAGNVYYPHYPEARVTLEGWVAARSLALDSPCRSRKSGEREKPILIFALSSPTPPHSATIKFHW